MKIVLINPESSVNSDHTRQYVNVFLYSSLVSWKRFSYQIFEIGGVSSARSTIKRIFQLVSLFRKSNWRFVIK